jgi:hypothetical protein
MTSKVLRLEAHSNAVALLQQCFSNAVRLAGGMTVLLLFFEEKHQQNM